MLHDFESTVPRGPAAVIERLATRELRAFFSQPFLASSWYDALPATALALAAAEAAGRNETAMAREGARLAAARDLKSAYRFLLSFAPRKMVLEGLLRVSGMYFDFGSATVVRTTEQSVVLAKTGVPVPFAGFQCAVIEGFVPAVLEMVGAKTPTARTLRVTADGEREGIETVCAEFDVRWSE